CLPMAVPPAPSTSCRPPFSACSTSRPWKSPCWAETGSIPCRSSAWSAAKYLSAPENNAAEPAGDQGQDHAGQAVEQRRLGGRLRQESLEPDLAHRKSLRFAGDDLAVLEHIGLGD